MTGRERFAGSILTPAHLREIVLAALTGTPGGGKPAAGVAPPPGATMSAILEYWQ